MVISQKGLSASWIIAEAGPTGKDLKGRPLPVNEARPRRCQGFYGPSATERNDVHLLYDSLAKAAAKAKDPNDPPAAMEQMQAEIGNRIEILAKLLPYAFLVDRIDGAVVEVTESEATDIEKTPTFLSYMFSEGTCLRVIFGPRTDKEAETLRLDKPANDLAPVKGITLEITGPNRAEVLALKKKIDRKAFEALLGPVMK